jgi:5-methyltetrahydrofolate--homocysteine methyltransferase
MSLKSNGLIVIGENFNATRKIKATSPRVIQESAKWGIKYTDLDGTDRILDVTESIPESEAARANFMIPHIGQACRSKDMDYITYAIKAQERAGAHIIDLCVDEMSVYPEERHEWMRWLVKTAQGITDSVVSIDSSDSETIRAGLEVHDSAKSRPAINSVNLEPGRQVLVEMATERNAILFANASGQRGMPQNAEERVENLDQCMEMMDKGDIPMEDRFLDALVFPIGAGSDFGNHYLDAVRMLREKYPEVHIFGGHSNVSFGLPRRKLVNQSFIVLSVLAGCDAVMVDPLMNSPEELDDFCFAANALTAKDEFSVKFIKHCREKAKRKAA